MTARHLLSLAALAALVVLIVVRPLRRAIVTPRGVFPVDEPAAG